MDRNNDDKLSKLGYKYDYVKALSDNSDFHLYSGCTSFLKLSNGTNIAITMDNMYGNFTNLLMYVDVNGLKGPNVLGKDWFLLVFEFGSGKLASFGISLSRSTLVNSCGKIDASKDQRCGALIQKDGWQIKDDYSW